MATTLNPQYADALSNLGMTYANQHDDIRAVELYSRAMAASPGHIDTIRRYGRLLGRQGRAIEAVALLRNAVVLSSNHAELWNELGTAQLAAAQINEAIDSLLRALQYDPQHVNALINLGVAHCVLDLADRASQYFEQAYQIRCENKILRLRATSCCPMVAASVAELDAFHTRLHHALDEMLASPPRCNVSDLLRDDCVPPFIAAHHGRDNLVLKKQFVAMFQPSFAGQPPLQTSLG